MRVVAAAPLALLAFAGVPDAAHAAAAGAPEAGLRGHASPFTATVLGNFGAAAAAPKATEIVSEQEEASDLESAAYDVELSDEVMAGEPCDEASLMDLFLDNIIFVVRLVPQGLSTLPRWGAADASDAGYLRGSAMFLEEDEAASGLSEDQQVSDAEFDQIVAEMEFIDELDREASGRLSGEARWTGAGPEAAAADANDFERLVEEMEMLDSFASEIDATRDADVATPQAEPVQELPGFQEGEYFAISTEEPEDAEEAEEASAFEMADVDADFFDRLVAKMEALEDADEATAAVETIEEEGFGGDASPLAEDTMAGATETDELVSDVEDSGNAPDLYNQLMAEMDVIEAIFEDRPVDGDDIALAPAEDLDDYAGLVNDEDEDPLATLTQGSPAELATTLENLLVQKQMVDAAVLDLMTAQDKGNAQAGATSSGEAELAEEFLSDAVDQMLRQEVDLGTAIETVEEALESKMFGAENTVVA